MKMLPPLGEEVLIAMRYLLRVYEIFPESDEEPTDHKSQGQITPLEQEVSTESGLYNLLWGSLPWNGEIDRDDCYQLGGPFFALMKLLYEHSVDVDCYLRLPEKEKHFPLESEVVHDQLRLCDERSKNIYAELMEKRPLVVKLRDTWPLIELLFMEYVAYLSEIAEDARRNHENVRAEVTNHEINCRFLGLPTLLYHRGPLHDFLSSYLAEYLRAFMGDRIDWDPKNVWHWDKQKSHVMQCLQGEREKFGDTFRINMLIFTVREKLTLGYPEECRPLETLFALEQNGTLRIDKFIPYDRASDVEFKLTMLRPDVPSDRQELSGQQSAATANHGAETWINTGDFKLCHKPLMLQIGDKTFRYESAGGKITSEEEKNRRKALKVLAIFVPVSKQNSLTVSFVDLVGVARKLNVNERTARMQLSIARSFLEDIGSGHTISRLTENKEVAAKEDIRLVTR